MTLFTAPSRPPATLRILVIDDSEADFRLIFRQLRQSHRNVRCKRVATPSELDEALAGETWDAVLSECNVPELDLQTISAKIIARSPDIPVILISGRVGEEEAVELLKHGASDFVLKDQLVRLIPCLERSLKEADERRARSQAESALQQNDARFKLALHASKTGVWEWNLASGQLFTTPEVDAIFGDGCLDHTMDALFRAIHPDERAAVMAAKQKALATHRPYTAEFRIHRADDQIRWLHAYGVGRYNDQGEAISLLGTVQDITDRKNTEASQRLAARVFESTGEGVLITDSKRHIVAANPALCQLTGWSAEDMIGQTPAIFRSSRHDKSFYQDMWAALQQTGQWRGEIWNRRQDGTVHPVLLTISTVLDERDGIVNYVGVYTDISATHDFQEKLDHLSHHDALTGLPNRKLFWARLEHSLLLAHHDGAHRGVLYIDLERFKKVNETLGYAVGDQLLQTAVHQMRECVGQGDTLARMGGDKFVVLVERLSELQALANMARQLLECIALPVRLAGHYVSITASIGISVYPQDGQEAHTLVSNAEVAMYQTQRNNHSTFAFFEQGMTEGAAEQWVMESELKGALKDGQFEVVYQPQLALPSGRLLGAEALLRWNHPQRGMVMPATFVPLLEELDLIGKVGAWVMEAACRQVVAWDKMGFILPRVAVNLSAQQFKSDDLIYRVGLALNKSGLEAHRLELEVTESMLMRDADASIELLYALKAYGIQLAADDFGTGYSSLAYLKNLPLHRLKIDRSFVSDLGVGNQDQAIVRTIIALAKGLDMEVIAEGVETRTQIEILIQEGCDEAQGFFFSHPMPAADLPGYDHA